MNLCRFICSAVLCAVSVAATRVLAGVSLRLRGPWWAVVWVTSPSAPCWLGGLEHISPVCPRPHLQHQHRGPHATASPPPQELPCSRLDPLPTFSQSSQGHVSTSPGPADLH